MILRTPLLVGQCSFAPELANDLAQVCTPKLSDALLVETMVVNQGSESGRLLALTARNVPKDRLTFVQRHVIGEKAVFKPVLNSVGPVVSVHLSLEFVDDFYLDSVEVTIR